MAINPDFRDLFPELNAAGVRYLLVGGYELAVHAQPRFTKDLDVHDAWPRRLSATYGDQPIAVLAKAEDALDAENLERS